MDWLVNKVINHAIGFHRLDVCPSELRSLLFSGIVGVTAPVFVSCNLLFLFGHFTPFLL